MSDAPIKPEPSPDFVVVAVDGAYFHVVNDMMALQFYRETSFPIHDQYNLPNFTEKQREILHEVRMSITVANRLSKEIDEGIEAYQSEIYPEEASKKLTDTIQSIYDMVHPSPEKEAKPLLEKIFSMMKNLNLEGQKKIVALLDKLVEENGHRFEEIIVAHSAKVEGR